MRGIDTVLVATDLHEKSDGALRFGAHLADLLGAGLVVVHVLMSRDLDVDDMTHRQDHLADSAMHRAETELAAQIVRVLGQRAVAAEVRFGDPALEIIAAGHQHGAGIIAVSVESRSRIGKLLLGSHAQQVLLESPIPVVGVRPTWAPTG